MNIKQTCQELLKIHQPMYVMLIGIPCSGKSTFIEQLKKSVTDFDSYFVIASTDKLIDIEAQKQGITYSAVFDTLNHKVLAMQMKSEIHEAIASEKSIIHDQTNLSVKSRSAKLSSVPGTYIKIALNFNVDDKILAERMTKREKSTVKIIPPYVMKSMVASYFPPSKNEGFSKIIEVNNDGLL